jgi:hypothetical protein
MLRSRRRYSSSKPYARTLSLPGKHLLKHPLGHSPDHNSINPSHKSNRCQAPN